MAETGKIVEITDQNFTEEVDNQTGLSMVDFWAAWCGPCRLVAPIVEKLAEDYAEEGLRVGKLDVDQNQEIASRFGVRSIPTLLIFRNGEKVGDVVGNKDKAELTASFRR